MEHKAYVAQVVNNGCRVFDAMSGQIAMVISGDVVSASANGPVATITFKNGRTRVYNIDTKQCIRVL